VRESTVYSAYSENGKRGERDGTSECDRETRRRRRRRRKGGRVGGREGGNATASASDRRETSSFMLGCCNSEWT